MKTKSATLTQNLLFWYHKNKRDLPWRKTQDPYKIWISEIMLQQTTVNAVIPYYEKWIKRFPTVRDVARAQEKTILNMWQGLGYYSRAKNIHKTSKILTKDFNATLPGDTELLRKLPGFGPYTVGAVTSIAFNFPLTLIDANVRRVMMRIHQMEGAANTTKDRQIEEYLKRYISHKEPGNFNQALMELGATICRSQNPLCTRCPVKNVCKAFSSGKQEIIPLKVKKEIQEVDAAIAVIERNNKYLIQQRPNKGLLANLWEFPGGKIEQGESAVQALKREIKEEVGIEVCDIKRLMKAVHYYTKYKVNLHVFTCRPISEPALNNVQKWVTLSQFQFHPMPSGSVKIVDKLLT